MGSVLPTPNKSDNIKDPAFIANNPAAILFIIGILIKENLPFPVNKATAPSPSVVKLFPIWSTRLTTRTWFL